MAPTPATQVDDELISVAAQGRQHGVESFLAEPAVWEEKRRDDDLLIDNVFSRCLARPSGLSRRHAF